ncbi:williams-beuren syndrome chromosomal region 16protein homolog [Lichtheimia corymbifera JMRC:FSU:9682]|uniref:Williams-beuren syndrome chromosomal region 16protein homolog n=1 Tax=Lichtheimia corymbifera JMRC:FSU:9682 TaxID=1263082 RepID=A0A068RPU7_9FUNG|nr:williams-beuren syndrome chromosomal region 16protein homolog [Lichtheimia corymbifera JMRC:FSU:9682]
MLKHSVYGWGHARALPLAGMRTSNTVFKQPVQLTGRPDYAPDKGNVTHVAAGWGHSLLATDSQRVYGYGLDRCGQAGNGLVFESKDKVRQLACGREHSHIVTTQGLYSFGNGMYGQLGVGKSKETHPGTFVIENKPCQVVTRGTVTDIACGLDHTVFATDHQMIYAMGWGADGQLGVGETIDYNVPKALPSLGSPIKKLAGSTDFTLALTADGRLWTWGNSEYGQGMTGAKVDRILEPVVLEHRGITDIAAGGPFSVVLTDDGAVHTCGYGALGLGKDIIETLSLKRIPGLKDIKRVFATTDYAAAITASGELFSWGLNGPSGRLGLGHDEHAFVPQKVPLDKPVADVALGTHHAISLCIDE